MRLGIGLGLCEGDARVGKNGMYIASAALIGKPSINHFLWRPFQKVRMVLLRMVLPRLPTYHYQKIYIIIRSS